MTVELPPEPLLVDVDALRIAQVFGNLLTNAAKYTPPSGRIRLHAGRDGGDVLVRVIDNGIGLAPRTCPQIFAMFAQVKPQTGWQGIRAGHRPGAGKALVELHGGTPRSAQRRARQGQRVQRAAGPNNISASAILIANTIV